MLPGEWWCAFLLGAALEVGITSWLPWLRAGLRPWGKDAIDRGILAAQHLRGSRRARKAFVTRQIETRYKHARRYFPEDTSTRIAEARLAGGAR